MPVHQNRMSGKDGKAMDKIQQNLLQEVAGIARLLESFDPEIRPEGKFEFDLWKCFRSYIR